MPSKAVYKGNELEDSVLSIERIILKRSPGLKASNLTIESKKIVVVDGVKHEIDVWVSINHGSGYASTFIFECKNWEQPVGKDEIIVFSEKIKAANAQRGYFVARSFSRYAKAQARKDSRLEIVTATQADLRAVLMPGDFHHVVPIIEHVDAKFGIPKSDYVSGDANVSISVINVNGIDSDPMGYVLPYANRAMQDKMRTFPSGTLPVGVYDVSTDETISTGDDVVTFHGIPIRDFQLRVNFKVTIIRPVIVSQYDVNARGRVTYLETVEIAPGITVGMNY